jgi:tetratricopeptide (TPR) repeat protein
MKNLFIISFLLILGISAYAQDGTQEAKQIATNESLYHGSDNEKARMYYRQAVGAQYQNEDLKKAISLYKKAIKEDPNFVEAYDNLGVCYRHAGDVDKAIESYKKSLEIQPNGPMAHSNLALIYNFQDKTDDAITEYKKVLEISPLDPEGFYGLTMVYLKIKDYDNAIIYATQAVKLYQESNSKLIGDGEYLLGQAYFFKGDKENASAWFDKAKSHGAQINPFFLSK